MIDPMVNLAFSLTSNKGAYAILVGSGISRAADIPTGWDVVRDLVLKVAALDGAEPGDEWEAWYHGKFGSAPGYSTLLAQLAKTQTERQALMRGYFEPQEGNTDPKHRRPTDAHRAIARLVKSGVVRVVLTTNFDRLLETALQDEGVAHEVLRTPDDLRGASPLSHVEAAVVKLHGDYLDPNAKNTVEELSAYDPRTDAYLDRLFEDFGLIVCGWSAEYDHALRAAISRSFSKRYSMFWATFRAPSQDAKSLIDNKKAIVIPIEGANSFFMGIVEHVTTIERHDRSHPLSIAASVAKMKRLLADPHGEIELNDFLQERIEAAKDRLLKLNDSGVVGANGVADAMMSARNIITEVCELAAAWGAWAKRDQEAVLSPLLASLTLPDNRGIVGAAIGFRFYPLLLTVYAAGIAATTRGNFGVLKPLLVELNTAAGSHRVPLLLRNAWGEAHDLLASDPEAKKRKARFSAHVLSVHRSLLRPYVREPSEYERSFNLFEYMILLANLQLEEESEHRTGRSALPVACWFEWTEWRGGVISEQVEKRARKGGYWLPSKLGFFDGRTERLHAAHDRLEGRK